MNAISPQRLEARLCHSLRAEWVDWISDIAVAQRRMAERPIGDLVGRAALIARATEAELAADALRRGDSIEAIRTRLRTLRGDGADGGQLFGLLDAIDDQEA